MQNVFIPTQNFQKFDRLCEELLSSSVGIEMAAVIGRAGRGKSTSAERVVTMNPNVIYVLYKEGDSHLDLLREIAFVLTGGTRPRYRQRCFEIIQGDLAQRRRIIIVDDADRMNTRCLNGLRNIHDICHVPILLVGEEALAGNLSRERRLISRTRDVLHFEPVRQPDIVVFYRKALGLDLAPELAVKLLRHSDGDFRAVLKDAIKAERVMAASGIKKITEQVVNEVCKEEGYAPRKKS